MCVDSYEMNAATSNNKTGAASEEIIDLSSKEIKIVGKLGEGTYGKVYKAERSDSKGKKICSAIKQNIVEEEKSFIGSLHELDILWKIRECEECVRLLGVHEDDSIFLGMKKGYVEDGYKIDKMHFELEFASSDLCEYIRRSKKGTRDNSKSIILQMCNGLQFLHENKIIHRDIKPSNFLVFRKQGKKGVQVKYCDFGLSKIYSRQGTMTPDLVTVDYRPPEICLGDEMYDYKVDLWSLACVIFEVLNRYSLIRTRNVNGVSENILCLESILTKIPHQGNTEEESMKKDVLNKYKGRNYVRDPYDIREHMIRSDEDVLYFDGIKEGGGTYAQLTDVISNCLRFYPKSRYSIQQVLSHPYFENAAKKNYNRKESHVLSVINSKNRSWAMEMAFDIYNMRKRKKILEHMYSHKAVFMAVDLYDRYLARKTDEDIRKEDCKFDFLIMYYIAAKYLIKKCCMISFKDLCSHYVKLRKGDIEYAEKLERLVFKEILYENVYRETIYDCSFDILNERNVKTLLVKYCEGVECEGKTPSEAYIALRKYLDL